MPRFFELKTQNFPIIDYEDNGFNGAEISNHLRNCLLQRGYFINNLLEEDWGWFVGIRDYPNIGVYCGEDYEIAILGKDTRFSFQKFKRMKWDKFEKLHNDLIEIFEQDPDMELLSIRDED